MKQIKKLFAIVIAMVMIVASMSFTAFADDPEPNADANNGQTNAETTTITPDGLTADTTITITGLDLGDEVHLYKLIEWANNEDNTTAGWVLTSAFADDDACKAVLTKINGKTEGAYELSQADVKAFTDVINNADPKISPVETYTIVAADNKTYTKDQVETGMYMALIKPAVAGTLYNPIIVSADFHANKTNSIDSSSILGSDSRPVVVKKETTTVDKKQANADSNDETANSYDVGDTVKFTVETTIPTFAAVYTEPSFIVTDVLSKGLALQTTTVKVYEDEAGNTEIEDLTNAVDPKTATGWTLNVPTTYIQGLGAPQKIFIKYDAKLTEEIEDFKSVNEETNTVTVEFSNNPNNKDDRGKIKDKTLSYTFSIDGSLFGQSGISTSELIKVAVDGNGNPIIQESSTNETYKNALAGAKFGLYTDSDCKTPYVNKTGENGTDHEWTDIETDSDGYMEINGLDEGTYYLKELTAPTGFVKDQTIHEIVIHANYDTKDVTEDGYTYDLTYLESYTITIDGKATSTYSMTLDGSEIKSSSINPSSALLNNTKGIELPATGGIGTTIFYAIGAILVVGAGILLVTRRRMDVG